MSAEVFQDVYASQYDRLYRDKDYDGECDLIEEAFREYSPRPVGSVLDLGCGTGGHAVRLAKRGFSVTGVDRSAGMLELAREKAGSEQVEVNWTEGDIRTVRRTQAYDAVLCMFAVLGYQLENADVEAALRNARRHLQPGGLFAFDVWYGPAVLHLGPTDRVRVLEAGPSCVLRTTRVSLDIRHHRCGVNFNLWEFEGDAVRSQCEELHQVRYFFPMELEYLLSQSGFRLASLSAFPTLTVPADENHWDAFAVAVAC